MIDTQNLTILKQKIFERASLLELVQEKIPLERKGDRYAACCPFHNEKTPSFYLFDQRYYCFGCQASGDVISWVQHTHAFSFMEALRFLAHRYGIPFDSLDRRQELLESVQHQKHQKALELAQDFFVGELKKNREALSFLQSRGFDLDSIAQFGFGFAPSGFSLGTYLKAKGVPLEFQKECSLIASFQGGRFYDFFQNRVMLPIKDAHGPLIAFAGRSLDGSLPKYKNSRFNKGKVLFGWSEAREAMSKSGRAIVVEGYFDALTMWQSGFKETVACQGTALTEFHLGMLSKQVQLVYLALDGDSAGLQAMLRSVEASLEFPSIRLKIIVFPTDEDPDSFLRTQGASALEDLIEQAEEGVLFWLNRKLDLVKSQEEQLQVVEREILPILRNVKSSIQKEWLLTRLSQLSGLRYDFLQQLVLNEKKSQTPAIDVLKVNLHHLQYEYLGHLFYFKSPSFEEQQVSTFVKYELQLPEVYDLFASRMMELLKKQESPSEKASDFFSLGLEPINRLILRFQKERNSFKCNDSMLQLNCLQVVHQKNKLKETMEGLKQRLRKYAKKGLQTESELAPELRALLQENSRLEASLRKLLNIENR